MSYVMFICGDPDHSEADDQAAPEIEDWFRYANERKAYLQGRQLQPTQQATAARVRDGKLLVTDGPHRDQGVYRRVAFLDCDSLEKAIEPAERNPIARAGRIELCPIHSMGGPEDWAA